MNGLENFVVVLVAAAVRMLIPKYYHYLKDSIALIELVDLLDVPLLVNLSMILMVLDWLAL